MTLDKYLTIGITAEMNLTNIIAESREVAQAFNKFADELERIEKKHAESKESEDNEDIPKEYFESGGC